jgi:protein-L-isoaspartate(D-aspartate) O-methyltransferase
MNFAAARRTMVDNQLRPVNVTDERVLAAMADLPREAFVPKAMKSVAYVGDDIQLGHGRAMPAPMVVGLLLQAAQVKPSDIVLEIGCGMGYTTAVLARLASSIVAIDSDKALAESAQKTLSGRGIDNVAVMEGPLAEGFAKQAPFDVIIVSGAVDEVPDALLAQLAEGGRLAAMVACESGGMARGVVYVRSGGSFGRRELFEAGTAKLPGFSKPKAFAFA